MLTMSRLPSSTYGSICLLVCLHFAWLLLLAATTTTAAPGPANNDSLPSLAPSTTPSRSKSHIVSYVNSSRGARPHGEFDKQRNEAEIAQSKQVNQIFHGLLQLHGAGNVSAKGTDDAPASERNTLDDEFSLDDGPVGEQHESSTEHPDAWRRIKLAIPVLEPVKHLLNTVNGGGVNDSHVRSNSHRLVGHGGVHHSHPHSNISSSAIETEEDRDEAITSTGFNFLELLGQSGTFILRMLQNMRQLFAASAGNASSSSNGGGGSGGGGGGGGDGGAAGVAGDVANAN